MKTTFSKQGIDAMAEQLFAGIETSTARGAHTGATVVALSGDLGAGKTTLTQAVARSLGVSGSVISPTFVIMKSYDLPRAVCARGFAHLVHIDAYRLNSGAELERLGWGELVADPENLILLEWPERVPDVLPDHTRRVTLAHVDEDTREMDIA